jgi:hypothetical protein
VATPTALTLGTSITPDIREGTTQYYRVAIPPENIQTNYNLEFRDVIYDTGYADVTVDVTSDNGYIGTYYIGDDTANTLPLPALTNWVILQVTDTSWPVSTVSKQFGIKLYP